MKAEEFYLNVIDRVMQKLKNSSGMLSLGEDTIQNLEQVHYFLSRQPASKEWKAKLKEKRGKSEMPVPGQGVYIFPPYIIHSVLRKDCSEAIP